MAIVVGVRRDSSGDDGGVVMVRGDGGDGVIVVGAREDGVTNCMRMMCGIG